MGKYKNYYHSFLNENITAEMSNFLLEIKGRKFIGEYAVSYLSHNSTYILSVGDKSFASITWRGIQWNPLEVEWGERDQRTEQLLLDLKKIDIPPTPKLREGHPVEVEYLGNRILVWVKVLRYDTGVAVCVDGAGDKRAFRIEKLTPLI